MQRAFTTRYATRVNTLKTGIGICHPIVDPALTNQQIRIYGYQALWDNGATNSAITRRVIEDLGIHPVRTTTIQHAGGTSPANIYLVNLVLPDNVMVESVHVSEVTAIDGHLPHDQRANVIIGMDIIGLGDFAVTNFTNKTTLSFRIPSAQEIDFVPPAQEYNILKAGNRHDRRSVIAKQRKKS